MQTAEDMGTNPSKGPEVTLGTSGFLNLNANTGKSGEILEEINRMLGAVSKQLEARGLRLIVSLMDRNPVQLDVLDKNMPLTLRYETLVFTLSSAAVTYAGLVMLEESEDMVSAAELLNSVERSFIRTEAFEPNVIKGIELKLGMKNVIPVYGAFGNMNALTGTALAKKVELILNVLIRSGGEEYQPLKVILRHLNFNATADKEAFDGKTIPTQWESKVKTDAGMVGTAVSPNLGSLDEEFTASGTIDFGIYSKMVPGATGRTEKVAVLVPMIMLNNVKSNSPLYPGVAEALMGLKMLNIIGSGDEWMYPLINSKSNNIGLLATVLQQKPIKLNDNSVTMEVKQATIKELVPEQPKLFLDIEYLSFEATELNDFASLSYINPHGTAISDKLSTARAGVMIVKAAHALTNGKFPKNYDANRIIVSKTFLPAGYYKDNNSGKMIPLGSINILSILRDNKNGQELAVRYSNIIAGESQQSFSDMLGIYSTLLGAENVFITGERIVVELSNEFLNTLDAAFGQAGMQVKYEPHINIAQQFNHGAILQNDAVRQASYGSYGQAQAGYTPGAMPYYMQ